MDNYKSFLLFLNNTLETNPWLFCYIIFQIFHPGSHQFNNDDWVKQRHCFGEEDLGGGDISMHHSLSERSMHSELIHTVYPGVPGLHAVAPACASNLILRDYPHCSLYFHHLSLLSFLPVFQPSSHFFASPDLHMADTFLNFKSNATSSERPSLTTSYSIKLSIMSFLCNSFFNGLWSVFLQQNICFTSVRSFSHSPVYLQ